MVELDFNPLAGWFASRSHVLQALCASLFTWGLTALGASLVFFCRRTNQKRLDAMLGFSAGVMLAASYWSLLAPAIDLAASYGQLAWFPAASGFGLGALALRWADKLLPHFHLGTFLQEGQWSVATWRRTMLLIFAVTLHNIPEGLTVGIVFGAVGAGQETASLGAAVALAIGMGLQNFPEGVAVAMPLRRLGWPRWRSFWYGQLSAAVEPVAAVLGAAAVTAWLPIMPYALAFAAGAMIYVVVAEIVPETYERGNSEIAALGAILGFIVMMILDTSLG
ncbi:ZIP family metal transporter [Methylothermus subterraneus]